MVLWFATLNEPQSARNIFSDTALSEVPIIAVHNSIRAKVLEDCTALKRVQLFNSSVAKAAKSILPVKVVIEAGLLQKEDDPE